MLMKNRIASFVDDRDGRFRVDRSIYLDEDLFNAEMECLFEGGWVYLAHEKKFIGSLALIERHEDVAVFCGADLSMAIMGQELISFDFLKILKP